MAIVESRLKNARRRIALQCFGEALATCALVASVVLLLAVSYRQWRMQPLWPGGWLVALPLTTIVGATLWTWRRVPSLSKVADWLDATFSTDDRFVTARAFVADQADANPLREAAVRECENFIVQFDVTRATSVSFPSRAKYLVVPAAALVLVALYPRHLATTLPVAVNLEAVGRAAEMSKLTTELARVQKENSSPELEKIVAQLKESAERVNQAAITTGAEANRTVLAELSAAESMLKKMLAQREDKPSAEELDALAAALEQVEASRDIAAALRKGALKEAAQLLGDLAGQLRDSPGAKALRHELGQALRAAGDRLGASEKGALARQMAITASTTDQPSENSAAMQRLAEMLRQIGGALPSSSQGLGKTMDAEMMRKLLAQLQNLKYQRDFDGSTLSAAREPGGAPTVLMRSFSKGDSDPAGADAVPLPTGAPGSERDHGTTASALGKSPSSVMADEAQGSAVGGVLGEGESLHDLVPATGNESRPTRRYQQIYEAMAPAAEAAAAQEHIPIGSRFYIKRYFQNIRPKE